MTRKREASCVGELRFIMTILKLCYVLMAAVLLAQPVLPFSVGLRRMNSGFRQYFTENNVGDVGDSRGSRGSRSDVSLRSAEINFDDTDDEQLQMRKDALELLDCITSPKNEDDPGYDIVKDMRRDAVLLNNDHSALKIELRSRGLRQNGDKMEMIARLLLHIIDPTINYSQMTGREVNLKYVDDADLATNKIRVIPKEDRETDPGSGTGPDAEDLMVLKRKVVLSSPKNAVGGRSSRGKGGKVVPEGEDTFRFEDLGEDIQPEARSIDRQKTVMDGLTRRELEFEPLRVKRSLQQGQEDKDVSVRAYVVGGRNVLKSWERNSAVVVLLPDEAGWRSKDVRVFADEISFFNQAIVVVPDLYRGKPWSKGKDEKYQQTNSSLSPEYLEWQASHPADRIFDDIVSCLRFAQQQYDSKALSVAGIGCGGGWALKAACDLSDIQCAAALAYSGEKKNSTEINEKGQKGLKEVDRAVSMNPFPGSTRGYPRTEEEIKATAEEVKRMRKSEELVEMDEEEEGVEMNLEEGAKDVESADLVELMKMAGLSEENEEKEIEYDGYSDIERYRDQLDADVASRATEIVTARAERGAKCIAEKASLSLRDLARLEPCGVLAVCPSMPFEDVTHVGRSLRIPSFLIFGELDQSPGAGIDAAEELHILLSDRLSEVADLSIRVYQGRQKGFAHSPKTDEDRKCSQEATAIGAIWLDVFSSDPTERTDGTGLTRLSDSFSFISNKDMARQTLQVSSIASYLHDDPLLFRNDRLADDV